jgi:hypothetical protein
MITVINGEITKVYKRQRLSKRYVGTFLVLSDWVMGYPDLVNYYSTRIQTEVGQTFDVFEGWGCRVLEHYPGQPGVHIGRYLGEES